MDPTRTSLPDVLRNDVGYLMGRAAHALATREITALHAVGLSLRAYGVLAVTAERPRPQTELAEVTGIDRTTLVSIVDDLEEAGLVERCPMPGDRRARLVTPTATGRTSARRGQDVVRAVERKALAGLDDSQRDLLLTALGNLVDSTLAAPVDLTHLAVSPRRRRSPTRH